MSFLASSRLLGVSSSLVRPTTASPRRIGNSCYRGQQSIRSSSSYNSSLLLLSRVQQQQSTRTPWFNFINNNNNNNLVMMNGMNKMFMSNKVNKSAAKRFRVRGNGTIRRNQAGCAHNTGYKSTGRHNRLSRSTGIKVKKMERKIRQAIQAF